MLQPVRPMLVALAILAALASACGGGTPSSAPDDPAPAAGGSAGGGAAATAGSTTAGSPAGGGTTGGSVAACDLLTEADIEETLGRTVERQQPGVALGVYPDGCEWFFEAEGDLGLEQLVVGTFPEGGRDLWERSYAGVAAEMGMEEVAGIGEQAFRQGPGSFAALVDDRIVDVFYLPVGVSDRAAVDETAKALLTRALARLAGAPVEPAAGAASPHAGTGDTDICALLSAAQIEEFALVPLDGTRPIPNGCRWVLDTGSPVPEAHGITAEVTSSGGRAQFDTMSALERVPGIGDDAAKLGGNTDGTVWAVRGDTLVKLQYALPIDTTDADPIVLPLLELVLNALP